MPVLGIVLLLIGVLLVIAETHAPGGTLGALGGFAMIAGGIIAIVSAGGSVALAVPVGVALGGVAGGWTLKVVREAAGGRHRRIRSGAEALGGHVGVVRSWSDAGGQVFVDGALWRARYEPLSDEAPHRERLVEGDPVVVEYVSGLTLCVRAAEEWELSA